MKLLLSLLLAYAALGLGRVIGDLAGHPLDRPFWAVRPSFRTGLIMAAIWVGRPWFKAATSDDRTREIAYGVVAELLDLGVVTIFFWLAISVAEYTAQSRLWQAGIVALAFLMSRFIIPWMTLLAMPVMLLSSIPLDLLFPKHKKSR